ncbi:MAG: amidase [Gammaproteobacteria bacterium]|nr:amidase [Gammaproteobacteria bacterium]
MDILETDATDLVKRVHGGELHPLDVIDAAIAACERLNPILNAVFSTRFERAREEAQAAGSRSGALAGIPTLFKDLGTPEAGEPQYLGNRVLKALDARAPADCHVVRKLKDAGAVSIGRTTVPELASGNCPAACENEAFGDTRNPWDITHTPMGSSGGSAAAVAAGIVPVAHGNDGGGSIRVPASANGVVGLKPSRGRVSWGPILAESWAGLATQGMLTRTVRDSALTLDAIAGLMPGDPYGCPAPAGPFREAMSTDPGRLRIGLCDVNEAGPLHPACRDGARAVGDVLADLGHRVEPAWPAPFFSERLVDLCLTIVSVGIAQTVGLLESALGRSFGEDDLELGTWLEAERGRGISGPEFLDAITRLNRFAREMAAWWEGEEGFDLLLCPTLAAPPPELGVLVRHPEDRVALWRDRIPYTPQFNITGQPAISLPLCVSAEGLPIGIQLAARYADEATLIRVGSQLEEAMPWSRHKPAVWVGDP